MSLSIGVKLKTKGIKFLDLVITEDEVKSIEIKALNLIRSRAISLYNEDKDANITRAWIEAVLEYLNSRKK